MTTGRGVHLVRIAGISVRAHWSVLLVGALLAWGLATGILPLADSHLPLVALWGFSALGALTLFASLTLHELAHSLVARRRGLAVEDITLWVFGGVSRIHDDWGKPSTELLVAAAGPGMSLLLAGAFLGSAFSLDALNAPAVIVVLLQWLGIVNAMLLVFNLLPAFPLDGGRILRSIVWWRGGDRSAATRAAARGGRIVALLLVLLGVADLLVTGDLTGAVWLMFIGWFLDTAAKRERQGEVIRHALDGVRVADAMSEPFSVPSWLTVQTLLEQYAAQGRTASLLTHGLGGEPDGVVTMQALKMVPPHKRAATRGSQVAVPLSSLPTAGPGDLLSELLPRLSGGRALVLDHGKLVGIVSPSDVTRLLMRGAGATHAAV